MPRVPDRITVETETGVFDRFSQLSVINDITGPSEGTFEIGDDGAWPDLQDLVAPGQPFTVLLNGKPRLTGRAEVNEVPAAADRGVNLQLVVRTKMSDARYRSADASIKVEGVSIKDFILAAYKPLGFTASDFVFSPGTAIELMTGKAAGGGAAPLDLEPIKLEQAKIQPPETIFEAVERHLRRHHATHWDAPDGRIVVGAPDDSAPPLYELRAVRGNASKANNIVSCKRLRDWTEIARRIQVAGDTKAVGQQRGRVLAEAVDAEVDEVATKTGHFDRLQIVSTAEARTQAWAESAARRDLSARARRKDAIEFQVDGWTYWNGDEQIPWGVPAVATVEIDALGRDGKGRYLLTRVQLEASTQGGCTGQLTGVGPGIWVL